MGLLCDKCRERPADRVVTDFDEPAHTHPADFECLPPGPTARFAICCECDDGQWHEVTLGLEEVSA